ncbi:Recombination protein RecR [Candidatus Magnetaquicoccaceae bacterium FCR-1]|uniref:Recombination protein RecR n=1 Tax=Candidatus Magnetaquiglobus chichijimensis TaxID=3141448 RepID=A0ABQ0C732_9PROT
MKGLPSLERAVVVLSRFPGVGPKSARRMVHHLLRRGHGETGELIEALEGVRDRIRGCACCHNLAEEDSGAGEILCWICEDPLRDRSRLCVVEEPSDLLAIEKAGLFKGMYHVLGGRLSPLDGVGPDALNLASLESRLAGEGFAELIVATNSTVEGEATAHFVARLAEPFVPCITRLAHGLPMGGELEYIDESTLYQAIVGRRNFKI